MIFKYRIIALTLCVAVALSLVPLCVHAQGVDDALPKADLPAETTKEIKTQSLGGMVVSGGTMNLAFFGVLGIFSLWAVTVVFERIFNLRRDKILPQSFSQQLIQLTMNPQTTAKHFHMLCQSYNTPASRISLMDARFNLNIRRLRRIKLIQNIVNDGPCHFAELSDLKMNDDPPGFNFNSDC